MSEAARQRTSKLQSGGESLHRRSEALVTLAVDLLFIVTARFTELQNP
jgi:hypothetical protein